MLLYNIPYPFGGWYCFPIFLIKPGVGFLYLKCYGKNVTRDISCEIISPCGILYKFCKSISNVVVSVSSKNTAFQRTKIRIQIIKKALWVMNRHFDMEVPHRESTVIFSSPSKETWRTWLRSCTISFILKHFVHLRTLQKCSQHPVVLLTAAMYNAL